MLPKNVKVFTREFDYLLLRIASYIENPPEHKHYAINSTGSPISAFCKLAVTLRLLTGASDLPNILRY
jgi:hypothetical protein